MKHVGILATTPEGAALCFRVFCQHGASELAPHDHPDVTLDCIALARSLPAWERADYQSVRATLAVRGVAPELPVAQDRAILHEIILAELLNGVFTDRARREYARIIERLAARGCDAVGLVCTEIPLLVPPDASPLPVLDSTRLLARAAFEAATGHRAPPTWRGGPVEG